MQDKPIEIITTPAVDLSSFFQQLIHSIVSHFPSFVSGSSNVIENIFGYIIGLSVIVSIMLFLGIIVSVERLKSIRKKESEIYDAKADMGYEEVKKGNPEFSSKWTKVALHIESDNENDWRQAILEADILLEDLLTKQGYKGEGIGEQLRRVSKADFKTLDQAWEGHKIRNLIAHEGSAYPLTKFEARRVINLFRKVFEEFFDLG